MTNKVEDFFITPLEAHFESQPTEGARDTILNDFEQYTPDDLTTAVEWLKRARQAQKTFPSPKECIKAIKAVVGGRDESSRSLVSAGQIDGSNYCQNAAAFAAAMQRCPVIKEGEPQWDDWMDYWHWLGARAVLSMIQGRDKWTVPTYFPEQFDHRWKAVSASRQKKAA